MKDLTRKAKWTTAVVLFGGFMLAFFMDATRQELHQWLGIAVGFVAAYHGWAHRSWVITVGRRILDAKDTKGRLHFLIDATLLLGFFVILTTGLVISSWLGVQLAGYAAWVHVHVIASVITLGLVVVKVGTHWRWLINVAKAQWASLSEPAPALARNCTRGASRREFLGLMGLVGVAAVLASAAALENVVGGSNDSSENPEAVQTVSASSSSSRCGVQCNRRCSYPGHCHRYADTNDNGRCDWGECV